MLRKLIPALLLISPTYSLAGPLLDEALEIINGEKPVVFGAVPVAGLPKESSSVLVPNSGNNAIIYVAYDADETFQKQFPVAISKSNNEILLTVDSSQNIVSTYPSPDIFSQQFEDRWGEEIADLLQQAHQQGLLESISLTENTLYISSKIFEKDGKLIGSGVYETELVIPRSVIDGFEGGWPGPERTSKPTYFSDEESETLVEAIETQPFESAQRLTGKWLIPLYIKAEKYGLGAYREVSHELIDFSHSEYNSPLFNTSINIQSTADSILLTYNDTSVRYSPITIEENEYIFFIEVETPEEHFKFVSAAYKMTGNTEKFVRGLSSRFPFVQVSHVGMGIEERFDGDRIACEWMNGYEFVADNTMTQTICYDRLSGEANVIDNSPYVSGTEGWNWVINDDVIEFENITPYVAVNKQTWVPIQTNKEGYTIILEYWDYATNFEGAPPNGYMQAPRANVIKLVDVSQYTEAYANGGFGGDNDGDNIEDSADTDDDNDGMPDYYEESFSLNHLNSADRDEDLDGDGLTNFEEFTLGTYPNDSDSDNDGTLDGSEIVDVSPRSPYDYDGDGVSDIVIRRPEIGQFIVARSSDGAIMRAFFGSQGSDIPLAGDFDGDGTTDLAIRRPSVKQFISRTSSDDSINRIFFGAQNEDIPVIADYDGDGLDDVAIRRPSTGQWFIKYSTTGEIVRETFGTDSSDTPAVSDYDGDGKADIAVRRQNAGQFIIKYSSTDTIDRIFFGSEQTDIAVPADFDGDGKADLAIRRPSNGYWFIKRSSDDVIERTFFGSNEDDIPVVADYDGDGKADIAIRRPSSGSWVAKLSSDNTYLRFFFGSKNTDIPLAAPIKVVLDMTTASENESGNEQLSGFNVDAQAVLIKERIPGNAQWLTQEVVSSETNL